MRVGFNEAYVSRENLIFFWGGGKVEQLVTVTLTKTFYIDLKLPFKRDPDGLIDNCGVSRTYLKNLTKLLTF